MDKAIEIVGRSDERHLEKMWNGQIACLTLHKRDLPVQRYVEGASIFSFALPLKGSMSIRCEGNEFEIRHGDIHTYAPGMRTEILAASDDYEGYALVVEEQAVNETPLMGNFVRLAYLTIAELGTPKLSLTDEQTSRMEALMKMLQQHAEEPAAYQGEALLALLQVLSIDLLNIQNASIKGHKPNKRFEEIFTRFLALIPGNIARHHDLAFYADCLNITTTYLSRAVKNISGHTVMHFLDDALATEASHRLRNSDQSIGDMAFAFGFSDQAAFTKFFVRMRGVNPREYRTQSVNHL